MIHENYNNYAFYRMHCKKVAALIFEVRSELAKGWVIKPMLMDFFCSEVTKRYAYIAESAHREMPGDDMSTARELRDDRFGISNHPLISQIAGAILDLTYEAISATVLTHQTHFKEELVKFVTDNKTAPTNDEKKQEWLEVFRTTTLPMKTLANAFSGATKIEDPAQFFVDLAA